MDISTTAFEWGLLQQHNKSRCGLKEEAGLSSGLMRYHQPRIKLNYGFVMVLIRGIFKGFGYHSC